MILRPFAGRGREIAPEYDLILLGAGSSAGAEDFSAKVVENLGALLVHGVAVRPGHPVILGIVAIDNRTYRLLAFLAILSRPP